MERAPRNMYDMEHATVVDTSTTAQMVQQFASKAIGDVFNTNYNILVESKTPVEHILLKIKGLLENAHLVMVDRTSTYITGNKYGAPVFISIFDRFRGDDDAKKEVHSLNASFYGSLDAVTDLKEATKAAFAKEKLARIKWWYDGRHGPDTKDVYLDKEPKKIYPEFYPDLGDPVKYMDDFLASDAGVLLMAGPPGTGKTTLLRNTIISKKLSAHVLYEEKLMEKDAVFQHFLFDYDDAEMLVIEDADTLLTARESDGNPLMARFLSVSDGLIKLPNKKLIFTTNISDYRRVDEALIRPGRCFGVINTRPLTQVEAQAAAEVANLPAPTGQKEYTLAEIFNHGYRTAVRQTGFGVRH